jgi:hypothetical protein
MTARRYSVMLTPQPDGGYTVTSPDWLNLVTEGETREEALAMARDCGGPDPFLLRSRMGEPRRRRSRGGRDD